MDKNQFYSLPIKNVKKETADCVSVLYAVPAELTSLFTAKPGQYVTLKADIGGESLRRCYSICEQETPSTFRIAVKKVPDGRFSNYVVDHLKAGLSMDVMPPMGQFTSDRLPKKTDGIYVAFAAGSGITPIIHLIRSTLKNNPGAKFTLVYQNSKHSDLIFREELMDLKSKYMGAFNPIFIFSRDQTELALTSGKLNAEKMDKLYQRFPEFAAADGFFLCGPEVLTEFISHYLHAKGFAEDNIIREIFVNQGQAVSKLSSALKNARHDGECELNFKLNGFTRTISAAFDKSILDSLLEKGVNVPYACHGGVCSTCKMKVEKGEVNMQINYALEKEQVEQGFALSCCSLPVSAELTLNYDI